MRGKIKASWAASCAVGLAWSLSGAPVWAAAQVQTQTQSAGQMISIPAGTQVPLTLVGTIRSKTTAIGSTVRAEVAFPVTVGTAVAIPAGAFVEGTLQQDQLPKMSKKDRKARAKAANPPAVLQIHFERLVYPSGYIVPLDAQSAAAAIAPLQPEAGTEMALAGADERGHGPYSPEPQSTSTTLPPLQRPGPNPVVVTSAVVGGFALLTTGLLLLSRHSRNNTDVLLYDAGYQISMTLSSSVLVDRSRASASAAAP